MQVCLDYDMLDRNKIAFHCSTDATDNHVPGDSDYLKKDITNIANFVEDNYADEATNGENLKAVSVEIGPSRNIPDNSELLCNIAVVDEQKPLIKPLILISSKMK